MPQGANTMQALDIARNISIAAIAHTYAGYAVKRGAHDAQEALGSFRDSHTDAFDSLKAWAENLREQTRELEAILRQCAGCGTGKICR
jgi:hypothetical protein